MLQTMKAPYQKVLNLNFGHFLPDVVDILHAKNKGSSFSSSWYIRLEAISSLLGGHLLLLFSNLSCLILTAATGNAHQWQLALHIFPMHGNIDIFNSLPAGRQES
ncbi:hypothetical protein OIU85_004773 [Salix viminalis]|uniref:Uncharacterized protein n=1 Tax=Salix viminalis TaxID=40686 RepID=A0A9Q0PT80_SALVM|nr:hypothetical protein OIU85_004773 [Salix viminalis]